MIRKLLPGRFSFTLMAIVLTAIISAPVLASPATATRALPASVEPGDEFDVTIAASGCGIFGQVIETLPDGFSYVGCLSCTADDIGIDQTGNTIKFTFLGDSVNITYIVKAPTIETTTTYTFHGTVKDENKNEFPFEDNDITVAVDTPPVETYILTIAVNGNGSTTPSVGEHAYTAGDVINIRATADSGWQFDSWDGDVTRPSSSYTTVIMDADKTVTADFIEIPSVVYTLTITCDPSEGGKAALSPATRDNQYETGIAIELTAIPSAGYVFDSWSGDINRSNNPTSLTMDSDKSVIANFVLSTPEGAASFTVSPLNIAPEQVQPNQQVEISINIANVGGEAGSYEAILYINEQIESTQKISIPPGSSKNVMFSITKAAPGTYTVSLGGQEGQFTVIDNQSPSGGLDTGSITGIIIIVALITALASIFRRIKRRT